MPPLELLTVAEVAKQLDVSRSRVAQLSQRDDFPAPYAITRGVRRDRGIRLWLPDDVERFAASWDRTLGRPKS
jgi:hypothetical protein